jgi:hypothetical protein
MPAGKRAPETMFSPCRFTKEYSGKRALRTPKRPMWSNPVIIMMVE